MLEVRASLLGLALAVTALASHAQSGAAAPEWLAYAGDAASTKYSSLAQIDESNVARLDVAWRQPSIEYPAGETLRASPILETTPLYASCRLLISSAAGMGAALDPTTGERLWVYDPYDNDDRIDRTSYEFRNRGGAFWRGEGKERFLLLSSGYLVSLDAATGKPDRSFGEEGRVDIRKAVDPPLRGYSWSSAPTVCGDTIVLGSSTHDNSMHQKAPPGLIQAYDIPTGELLWVFHIIPRKGEPGYETWEEGSADYTGGGNVWGWFSCDADLDMVYANTSTPNNDWYGGHRPGAGLYGESIVALRTRTGERVWHFQAIRHGLWDYDFPAAPVLSLTSPSTAGRSRPWSRSPSRPTPTSWTARPASRCGPSSSCRRHHRRFPGNRPIPPSRIRAGRRRTISKVLPLRI